GNVREWCQTRWQDEKRKVYRLPYPNDDREKLAGGNNAWRVRRGGSWVSVKTWQRCGARSRFDPNLVYWSNGFRLVLSPFFADSAL
ncbi:MAG: SUMF1/EgtB/PvdO family nonheme iron enzyme, partial [Chloroflexi bacterium]|nr:SUMF1/EgtB/PvdO family nonheme iron enzyme [Chloroflexota bacterium]